MSGSCSVVRRSCPALERCSVIRITPMLLPGEARQPTDANAVPFPLVLCGCRMGGRVERNLYKPSPERTPSCLGNACGVLNEADHNRDSGPYSRRVTEYLPTSGSSLSIVSRLPMAP